MKIVFWLKKFEPLMLLLHTEGRQRKEGHLFTDKLHESAASNNPDLGMDYTKF